LRDSVTVILATVGTVLGFINTLVLLNTRRVRLRVRPQSAVRARDGVWSDSTRHMTGADAGIEVINLSSFPVTIAEVGYTLPRRRQVTLTAPVVLDGKGFPRRLDPREGVTVYVPVADLPRRIGKAYARTSCGVTRFGKSPALDDLKRRLAEHM